MALRIKSVSIRHKQSKNKQPEAEAFLKTFIFSTTQDLPRMLW